MPSNTYFPPVSGIGFDRGVCLTPFNFNQNLAAADYNPGNIYSFDGTNLTALTSNIPVIFGSWVYNTLGGQNPIAQPNSGIQLLGGAYGGLDWTTTAFTGTEAIEVQTTRGGVVAFNPTITGLNYVSAGYETFVVYIQVTDNLPDQILLQFYEQSTGWTHAVWWGVDKFQFPYSISKGPITAVVGQWIGLTFTAQDMNLTAGMTVTGVSWAAWNSNTLSTVVFSDTGFFVGNTPGLIGGNGFIDSTSDGVSGFYVLAHTNYLYYIQSLANDFPLLISLPDSPSIAYTGITLYSGSAITSGIPYLIGNDGTVYNYVLNQPYSSISTFTTPPLGMTSPARWLKTDNNSNFYTMFSESNSIATLTVPSSAWTVSATPFTATFDTFHYSHSLSKLLLGGSNYLTLSPSSPVSGLAYAANTSSQLLAVTSGSVNVWNYSTSSWSSAASSISGSPTYLAVTLDGNHLLISNTSNNLIQQRKFNGSIWTTPASDISLTNASAIAIAPNGLQALVCQPSQNKVSILERSGDVWSTFTTIAVSQHPNNISINPYTSSAIVTTVAGITFLNYNGITWSTANSISLSPPPIVTACDVQNPRNPRFYAAGNTGTNITVYVFEGNTSAGQYTLNNIGVIGGLMVVNYQVMVSTTNGLLEVGYDPSTSTVTSSSVIPTSGGYMAWVPNTIDYFNLVMIAGSNTIWEFVNDKEFLFERTSDSQVAIASGTNWAMVDLSNRNRISSITTDPTGNIYTISTDNYLYKIDNQSTIDSSYNPYVMIPPTGQFDGVPLGFSKLLYWAGSPAVSGLYSASCMTGGLVKVSG